MQLVPRREAARIELEYGPQAQGDLRAAN